MPTLVEKRTELEAKRKQLGDIMAQAGADMDMSKVTIIEGDSLSKVEQIKHRNEELTALGKEVEELVSLESVRRNLDGFAPNGGGKSLEVPGENGGAAPKRKAGPPKSLGELFTSSKAFSTFNGKKSEDAIITFENDDIDQLHAIFPKMKRWTGQKALFDSASFPDEVTRMPGVPITVNFQEPVLDDLIPEGRTTQSAVKYMREIVADNGAAPVAEGGQKPESALEFDEQVSPVRKIATVLPVTDEAFEDEPFMRDYVETRLRFFMDLARENQLLNGNGTAPNLRGILNTSGIQTQALGADPVPDAIFKAMMKISVNAFLEADAVVMHPLDWQDIRLLRTTDGIYIWGAPMDVGPERIWGLPIIRNRNLTEGTALVGAFQASAMKFRRSEVSFSVSDQHADFFITNKLMLRVEERLAFVVFRPQGFCTVTGI